MHRLKVTAVTLKPASENELQMFRRTLQEAFAVAVVRIHPETQRNSLDLLFISPEHHSCGLGSAAWKAIEAVYPETGTPYFEKRNIHFYVNKCGFKIVEFYTQYHTDPTMPCSVPEDAKSPSFCDEFFRFEKLMKF